MNAIHSVDGAGPRHWSGSRSVVNRRESWARRWHLISRTRTSGTLSMRIKARDKILWVVSVLWRELLVLWHWTTHMWLVWVRHLRGNGHLSWSHLGSGHWTGLRDCRRAVCPVAVAHVWRRLWVLELVIDLHANRSTAWLSWCSSVWWVLPVWPVLALLVVLLVMPLVWHLLMATSTAATGHSSPRWTHA